MFEITSDGKIGALIFMMFIVFVSKTMYLGHGECKRHRGNKMTKIFEAKFVPPKSGPNIHSVCYTLGKVLCGVRGHFRQAGLEHKI